MAEPKSAHYREEKQKWDLLSRQISRKLRRERCLSERQRAALVQYKGAVVRTARYCKHWADLTG